jgi:hypothetical protein
MNRHVLAACVVGLFAAATSASPSVASEYFCNPCGLTIWELNPVPTAQQNSGGAVQQATDTNPLFTGAQPATATATGTYTGFLSLQTNPALPPGTSSTIGDFLLSDAGTVSASLLPLLPLTLSASGFTVTTLFSFTGSVGGTTSGTITHDDGITLYAGNPPGAALTPSSASAPTTPEVTSFSGLTDSFTLVYSADNGNPEVLDLNVVPLPSTWIMLLTAFCGLGFLLYRRKDKAAAPALAAA